METTEQTALLSEKGILQNGIHVVDVPLTNGSMYEDVLSDCCESTSCLSLEELIPFKNDPWWHNLRRTIFCSFWLTLLLTFLVACSISYFHSKSCEMASEQGKIKNLPGDGEGVTKLAT